MDIVEVKQSWPDDTIRIDVNLGNYCNYKCWYCWPGSNEGTHKFPDFDTIVNNLSYLLDYYLNNTNKRKFDFNILGGEATHWPRFLDFIKYFKEHYDCVFTVTTNGSKKIEWWKEAVKYLDYIVLSSHIKFADINHLRDLADLIYENNTIVVMLVLMDPTVWDECINSVNFYKKSKRKWSIRYVEIIHEKVQYTPEQKKVMQKLRARRANLFWFFKNNKSYRSNPKVVTDKGKTIRVKENQILLDRLNNFKGWECNAGIDWISVKVDGTLSAICGNELYNLTDKFNLYESGFIEKFNPKIIPTTCNRDGCWCLFETNMSKRKVIPIHEN